MFTDSDDYPSFADLTADFVYTRLMRAHADEPTGYPADAIAQWAARAKAWAGGKEPADLPRVEASTSAPKAPARDVFVFFINGAKERAPHAAQALIRAVG